MQIYKYWGKADKHNQYHPLPYHCLDVAAVGKVFLEKNDALRKLLSQSLGLDDTTFITWQTFFLALHDVGKFSKEFQNLKPKLLQKLQHIEVDKGYPIRHDCLGFLIWEDAIVKKLVDETGLNLPITDEYEREGWKDSLNIWAKAVTGHHGQPPQEKNSAVKSHFSKADQIATQKFTQECIDLFLQDIPKKLPTAKTFYANIKPISWWLAGITVISDWIGSNRTYFQYQSDSMPLAEYWEKLAIPGAHIALQKAEILPTPYTKFTSTAKLVNSILGTKIPTPLQTLVSSISISNQPQLFILEDVTGAGKTEAAIILAHRLMSAGLADGFYIGLPTMATANAMYERMAKVYQSLFIEKASLILAHGKRDLSATFRQSILPQEEDTYLENNYANDEETATAYCAAWLADNRKKSLLADIGIGTLDQALLAILTVKYQSLRLLGLSRKVLIVDEVHAYDPYMNGLLKTLLEFHASIGGSAILLSATLPQKMRQELVKAYCKSGNYAPPPLTATAGYPLLTLMGGEGKPEYSVETRSSVKRSVKVQLVHDDKQVEQQIIAASKTGQCVCWIRNTVADAIDSYNNLRNLIPVDKLDIFHARFTMGDRLDKEENIVNLFGDKSSAEKRQGQILIATQVVEQSLDLDFDIMFSDLAPIDLLIQRAGRLCRHARDEKGNRIDGDDKRGEPCLFVYSPVPVDEPNDTWFADLFPKGSYVYANHGQLWLTARLLQKHGSIVMPDGARILIEGVYNQEMEAQIPAGLQEQTKKSEDKQSTQRGRAKLNALYLKDGYSMRSEWNKDTLISTRLQDEPTVVLRLARWDGKQLEPWYPANQFEWQLSEVNIRALLIGEKVIARDSALQTAIKLEQEQMFDKGKWSILIGLRANGDDWVGEYSNEAGDMLQIIYNTKFGLQINR